jgi:hypothetical protein
MLTTMPMPEDPRAFDTMLGVPSNRDSWQKEFTHVHDKGSADLKHPAGYMFKDLPEVDGSIDYVDYLIHEMDKWGVAQGLVPVYQGDEYGTRAVKTHPDRLYGVYLIDPNKGMDDVRALQHANRELGAIAAACFPSGTNPQVSINGKQMYPFYAKCVELDIPMFINAGVPGPRMRMEAQHVMHLDEVCYDFPELKIVTRHGGEPWEELLVKLMLKWPGLYYSTSAFAPKHFPKAIINYANTRGANKVMYAGYFPSGLSLERIFTELRSVPFKDDVWPKFLRENALRVLNLT